ncbi:hypothetical protein Gohar_012632, partial [Gossypium harknessii]|nr:hypothetical protein [Gossypium harknessii]
MRRENGCWALIDIIQAELWSIYVAWTKGLKRVVIENDNAMVVDTCVADNGMLKSFIMCSQKSSPSPLSLTKPRSIISTSPFFLHFLHFSLCAGTLLPGLPQIYHTARVFKAPSKYVFDVKDPGTHIYDGHLAYKDLDPSAVTNYLLASPFYVDLVVDADHSGIVNVTVGPSNKSMAYAVDAIRNGVEIMKMSNWMGRFDGTLPAESVLKCLTRKRRVGFLLPLIALVCLLLSLSAIIRRRKEKVESVLWSKLPMEVHEISPKQVPIILNGMFEFEVCEGALC